jgi:hypothetical protein
MKRDMLWKIWGGLAIGCPICETYQLNPTDDYTIPEDAPIFMTGPVPAGW